MRTAFRVSAPVWSSATAPILLGLMLAMTAATGCQSRNTAAGFPAVRLLQAEIGNLNLDTAIQRFGPPANRIELKDHSVIAEWEVGTETPPSFTFGLGSSSSSGSGSGEPVMGPTVGGGVFHVYRQLQFDAGHRLVMVQDIKR